jgi:hypothetical protein
LGWDLSEFLISKPLPNNKVSQAGRLKSSSNERVLQKCDSRIVQLLRPSCGGLPAVSKTASSRISRQVCWFY